MIHIKTTIFFILSIIIASKANYTDDESDLYIIQSTGSSDGFVVDAVDPTCMTIQKFTGVPSQLWRFECGSFPGKFFIYNAQTGKLLTSGPKADPVLILVVPKEEDSLRQEWYLNAHGQIQNAGFSWNLDVWEAHFRPGNIVTLYEENGTKAQNWAIKKASSRKINANK